VIVNDCNQHGTWFDKDQLRRVVEFIRAGGIDKERARQVEELEDAKRQVRNAAVVEAWSIQNQPVASNDVLLNLGISAVGKAIQALLDR
jgi:hypothetical protein